MLGLNCKLCLRGTPSTFAIVAWASSHLLLKLHGPWAVASRQEPSSTSLQLAPSSHQAPLQLVMANWMSGLWASPSMPWLMSSTPAPRKTHFFTPGS